MAIGLEVDFLWYPIGTGDFLHSFFSSICYHLEDKKWGSRFPHIMNELYQGRLSHNDVDGASKELNIIRAELSQIAPDKVIWDIEDLNKQPPWGNEISSQITDLSNYYVTNQGDDLIELIFKALQNSKEEKHDIIVKSL